MCIMLQYITKQVTFRFHQNSRHQLLSFPTDGNKSPNLQQIDDEQDEEETRKLNRHNLYFKIADIDGREDLIAVMLAKGPLRWVLWDVKDTLMEVLGSAGKQYCKEAEKLGLSLSHAEVDAAFERVYRDYSCRYPNYGKSQGLNGQTWWMKVVKDSLSQCGVQDPTVLNTVANNAYWNFRNATNWKIYPDVKPALERCSSLGLKLGVVSNFDDRLEEILRSCGLLSYFSFVISSEEAGVAKPSPHIFVQALQKCGTSADNVAHVGDHFVNDYLASGSAGIHGILLDRHNKYKEAEVPQEQRIVSLEELPSRLQQLMHQ